MHDFRPTTEDYGLLALPLDEAAHGFAALFGNEILDRSEIRGGPEEMFPQLEPLTMAVDRTLLISNGANWTRYFSNGLLGSDVFLVVSRIARTHGCTGVRVVKSPQATIFEAYENQERGGDANNIRRSIFSARDGKWTFGSNGKPYSFENAANYGAKQITDRFTPEHLEHLLSGLGAPTRPLPEGQPLTGVLFVQKDKASHLKRWTYSEVQAGSPWKAN